MVRTLILILTVIFHISSTAHAVWELPNTPMSGIGDPGSFYLNQEGVTFHVFNNDYIGLTDKLNTASGSLFFYVLPTNKRHGWEFSVQRRLLTPILRTRFADTNIYNPPKGVYADQLESRAGYSYTNGHLKYEMGVSGEYYAGLGGSDLQQFIHKVIGAADETAKYGPKIDKDFVAGSMGLGFLTEYALLMVYGRMGPIMRDATARLNLKFGKEYQFGFQGEVSQQFQSRFYGDDIKDYRYGYGFSYKKAWYQFTANYVSPYLKYDKYGQYYISPMVLSYEW